MMVLVVEDEVLLAMEITMKLKQKGHKVCPMASSGKEALEIVAEYKPDVAILDISISGEIDGITLARKLHEEYGIPVIFMSGYAKSDMLQNIGDLPFVDYLNKPIRFEELSESLQKIRQQ